MSVQVSYKNQFLLGIMLFLIVLLVLEGSARLYELFNPHCTFLDKDAFSNTNYFLVRITCLDHNNRSFEKDTILLLSPNQHSQTININSYGFRGPEITLEKPENTYRIFMVGGSTIFGVGSTSDNTTIPGYLQKKFDELNLDFKVEVINAGIGGADSASESYYIKTKLINFDPDLFIIYDGWNDAINDVKFVEYEDIEKDVENEDGQLKPFKFANFPFYRTPFVVYDILFWRPDPVAYNIVNPDLIPIKTELWQKRWQENCETNNKHKIKTVIAVQSILGTGNKPLSPDELFMVPKLEEHKTPIMIIDALAQTLPDLDAYCDKTADFRDIFDDVEEPVYFDLGHPTDFGNEIVAQRLYDTVLPFVMGDSFIRDDQMNSN